MKGDMDEVFFYLSEKREVLRIWILELTQRLMELTENAISYISTSPVINQLDQAFQITWANLISLYSSMLIRTSRLVNEASIIIDSHIIARITPLIGPEINKATLYAGAIGFTIGGGLGFIIGNCLRSPQKPITLMRAIACTDLNGTESISILEDAVVPVIVRPNDVLIEVVAATLDPVDIRISSGYAKNLRKQVNRYNPNFSGELPIILGREGSGYVADIGTGVTNLDVGDSVYFATPAWGPGCLAQYIVLESRYVARKPVRIGYEGAASLAYCGSIAWHAVVKVAGLSVKNAHTKSVLVHCGTTGAGWVIVQLAASFGSKVTVTCLNRASSVMKALGAEEVLSLETFDVEAKLLRKSKYDVVFNTSGPIAAEFCLGLVNPDGIVVTTSLPRLSSDQFGIASSFFYAIWIRIIHGIFGLDKWSQTKHNAQILDELTRLIDSGRIQPYVDQTYKFEELESALKHVNSANAVGRTLFRINARTKSSVQKTDRPDLLT